MIVVKRKNASVPNINPNRKDTLQSYLMLAPMLIGFALFTIYPMMWLIRWSWFDYNGISSAKFIGFENYVRAFTRDTQYWDSLWNTGFIVVMKFVIEIPLALFLAIVLNSKKKINSFFRTIFFSPTIVSTAIIGIVFYLMFEPFLGAVNQLLKSFNVIDTSINWFGNKWLADIVIVIASVWKGFGVNMIFFLMGLQNIPQDIYECADIDGVTRWQRFTRITLPMLSSTGKVIMMLFIVNSIKMSDLVLVLTNGQPGGTTEVVMSYTFKYFFSYGAADSISQYGYSSALAVITAIILSIVVGLYLWVTRKVGDHY
ncbi:carbohydrate ABC transporter permease [Cohnella abietis]|uniref:Sugar ABC transporter permease n=1 Tax=Cohnella abietis TaxID=2507935 RepID=A0A3T1DEQ7_9BACL|nr:sugar ABC transporter permease [Cohnella abietis]BBI36597.1 sugar ABC transporter permease [Cohnella abietis]